MDWTFNGELLTKPPQNCFGFIYIITRTNNISLDTPTKYIGKKQFFFKRKEKGSQIFIESDWKSYYGSSDLLKADIEKYGKENFKREIIYLSYSKQELTYMELNYMFLHEVLKSGNGYYNASISGKFHKCTYGRDGNPEKLCKLFEAKLLITNGITTKYIPKSKLKLFVGYTTA